MRPLSRRARHPSARCRRGVRRCDGRCDDRRAVRPARTGGVPRQPQHLDRLCRHGTDRSGRCRPGSKWAGPMSARGARCGRSRVRDGDGNALHGDVVAVNSGELPCPGRQWPGRRRRGRQRSRRYLDPQFGPRHPAVSLAGGARRGRRVEARGTAPGTRRSRSSTGRGARTRRPIRATASRPSGSSSNPAGSCRCRCTITAPNTGSWCRARRW